MNDQTNERWESEMSTEFDRRVRDLHEAPLTLESVRGKAVGIRRKRRAVAAGSLLAAAAVIVPVAVAAGNGLGDTGPRDVPLATSTPSATDAASIEPAPAGSPAFIEGNDYHRADGSVFELPAATYSTAATLGDRVVAERNDEGNLSVDVIEEGGVVATYETGYAMAISNTGETVAFVTRTGEVQTIWADGERVLAQGYAGWSPQAVLDGPTCEESDDCRVVLRSETTSGPAVQLDAAGDEAALPAGVTSVKTGDGQGRLAVITRVTDYQACGSVYDEGAERLLFDTCDVRPTAFSPDGRLLLGDAADAEGIGSYAVVVVDAATGDEVLRLEPGNGFINRAVWVDDDTIAASVFDDGAQSWTVQTLTAGEDAPTVVEGPVAGNMDEVPFFLLPR